MANTYEKFEHIGTTLLPLPYAQLTRFITLIFLAVILPAGLVQSIEWGTIPLQFIANLVYFLTDQCASQMEMPFGGDPNDVSGAILDLGQASVFVPPRDPTTKRGSRGPRNCPELSVRPPTSPHRSTSRR